MTHRTNFVLLAIVWVILLQGPGAATADDNSQAAAAKLPIKRVVLFSSGVGYFQHQGKVDGNATVDLKLRVESINDLLKSGANEFVKKPFNIEKLIERIGELLAV